METNEISIPVPWGHIAAKTWGKPTDYPILTIHGIFDNAGTFDLLIPHLPSNYYYICIDLPGHGRSSHLPGHLTINNLDYVTVYRFIYKHFEWKEYYIMAHSLGGQIALKYYELYPREIRKMVILDAPYFPPFPHDLYNKTLRSTISALINHKQIESPTYSYDIILEKLMNSRWNNGWLTEEGAVALANRVVIEENGKYKFGHDVRLKFSMQPPFDMNYALKCIRNVELGCPLLMIICKQNEFSSKYGKLLCEEWEKKEKCVVEYIDANHDAHLLQPELVASIVGKFLNFIESKL